MDEMNENIELAIKLDQITQMKERMLMAISHELRTPLNAMYGSAELLELSKNLDENEKQCVNNIRQSARALKVIVNNIMNYTECMQGEIEAENTEFTLHDMIEEIRTIIFMKAVEKKLGFRIWVDPDIPKKLKGDIRKIHSVLMHLLQNAIKNTQSGLISLSVTKRMLEHKIYLYFVVEDTGIGISQEEVKYIFEPFSISDTGDRNSMGMRLGLPLCQEYIKLLGGQLTCKNCLGKGIQFSFQLELEVVDKEPSVTIINKEAVKLLIVMDIKWRREHMKRICNALGLSNVMLAEDVEDLEEECFTHMLLDTGEEQAKWWLRKQFSFPCEKILVISSNEKHMGDLKKASCIFYRPFTIFMLAGYLNQWSEGGGSREDMQETLFRTKGVKALVVDDNSVNLMIGSNILRQFDMEVDEADSGTLAIQMYYNNKYDIILMDYRMPDTDGIEITRNICNFDREEDKTVIIALSANVTEEITEAFLCAGAKDVMAKPIEIRELSRILRKWLPDEKIIESNGQVLMLQEERNKLCMETMQISFCNVQDLDWKNALIRMNGTLENYVKILKIGYGNILEQMLRIERKEKNKKAENMSIYFHSLKGIFSNMGALKLSEASKKLEENPEQYDLHYIQKVDRFTEQLKEALTLYEDILASYQIEREVPEMSKEEYLQQLMHLKECIQRFEFNEIHEIADVLIQASKGRNKKYLMEVMESIEVFEYDEALHKLKKVMAVEKKAEEKPDRGGG